MKNTKITTANTPTVIKDEKDYSQLLLNRTNPNDKKSYIFGIKYEYSTKVDENYLKYTSYNDGNFINKTQTPNVLTFTGVTKVYYEDGVLSGETEEEVVIDIPMENQFSLKGTYIWHGIPLSYEAVYERGLARVLYTRQKDGGDYEYKVLYINEKIDNLMCENNWTPIGIYGCPCNEIASRFNKSPFTSSTYDNVHLFVSINAISRNSLNGEPTYYHNIPEMIADNIYTRYNANTNGAIAPEFEMGNSTKPFLLDGTSSYVNPSSFYTIEKELEKMLKGDNFTISSDTKNTTSGVITNTFTLSNSYIESLFKGYTTTQAMYSKHLLNKVGSGDTTLKDTYEIDAWKYVQTRKRRYNPNTGNYDSSYSDEELYGNDNNAPYSAPASICVNYSTIGTNYNDWYLPSFGEFFCVDKSESNYIQNMTHREEIDMAAQILINNGHIANPLLDWAYFTCNVMKFSYSYKNTSKSGTTFQNGILVSRDKLPKSASSDVYLNLTIAESQMDVNRVRPFIKFKFDDNGTPIEIIRN